jgi:VCBS repeat-containing protein
VNDAPVAVADSAKVNEDETLTVKAAGVLGNDTDVDGDVMTAVLVAGPAHGKLALNPDGSYTYTGEKDFFGDDSFTYKASDGTLTSDVVTVGITVVGVNDPPVTTPDAYEVNEDVRLAVEQPGILVNDNDIDSPTLSAVLVTTTSHGDLVLAPDGSFTYTPIPNFFGIDTFVYHASDGDLESGDTTVTISVAAVNDPPVASPDAYAIDEDTVLTVAAPGVMANDSDVDGDALRVRLFEQPANGSVILSADGSFEYTPDLNYNGTDTFTYQLSDGEVIVVGTVTITIRAVYDPPDANNDSYATTTGTTLTIAAPGVLANDLADTGLTLTADLVTGVAHGALTLNPDGSFTYTTSLTAAGTDSFTYRVNDGTSVSSPATVSITIAAAGGTGGHGEFNGFTRATQAIYDVDELNLHTSGAVTLQPKLGKIVTKYGSAWYIPSRGQRGHDTFIVGGVRFQVDVLSDIWGD